MHVTPAEKRLLVQLGEDGDRTSHDLSLQSSPPVFRLRVEVCRVGREGGMAQMTILD